MTRQWLSVLVVAGVATAAVIGAQGQAPANAPPGDIAAPPSIQRPTPAPAAQPKANTVTITGCMQGAPIVTAAATNPKPGQGASAATRIFYVNNVPVPDAKGDRPVGTSGLTIGYRLAGDNALMTPHLNHQVRIVGTLQSSNASRTGGASAAAGSTAAGPTLKVESVTMVSENCEPAK